MQTIQLVELATVVVLYAEQFVAGKTALNARAFDRYWKHSKTRLQRWTLVIRSVTQKERLERDATAFFYAVAEEIFAADVLNRVWTSVGYSLKSPELADRAQSPLQSVAAGHAEVRNRLLHYMSGEHVDRMLAKRLDHGRKLAESWTDLLLAFLPQAASEALAFDTKRLSDHRRSIESPPYRQDTLRRIVRNVRSCSKTFAEICPHENLNRLVANSITTALGPDLLDSVGPFHDLWQTRLTFGTQDTLDSVEVLLAEESGTHMG